MFFFLHTWMSGHFVQWWYHGFSTFQTFIWRSQTSIQIINNVVTTMRKKYLLQHQLFSSPFSFAIFNQVKDFSSFWYSDKAHRIKQKYSIYVSFIEVSIFIGPKSSVGIIKQHTRMLLLQSMSSFISLFVPLIVVIMVFNDVLMIKYEPRSPINFGIATILSR